MNKIKKKKKMGNGKFYLINVTHDDFLYSFMSEYFSCCGTFTSSHNKNGLWTKNQTQMKN